ncbi:MAG: NAD+ synthase [Nitrososphaerales archaeon]|jgi:NAD+ synthase
MAKPLPAIDLEREERRIAVFVRRVVARSGARGVVVGLSGGVDSAVVFALCVRALGKDGVLAALLPSNHTPPSDTEDAVRLADEWRVKRISVAISPLVDALISATGSDAVKLARANVQARVRMTMLYYLANSRGLLVVGTGDRSEELLGFFTKFGDGGVDFLPIAHLYKTQVRLMGKYLGIPSDIVNKPASPQLWPGHTAEEELPAGYEKLDIVMHCLFDAGGSVSRAATEAGVSRTVVHRILEMNRKSAHKRTLPPSLRPPSG